MKRMFWGKCADVWHLRFQAALKPLVGSKYAFCKVGGIKGEL